MFIARFTHEKNADKQRIINRPSVQFHFDLFHRLSSAAQSDLFSERSTVVMLLIYYVEWKKKMALGNIEMEYLKQIQLKGIEIILQILNY